MEHPLDDFLNKYKLPLAAGFVGLVLLIGGVVSSGLPSKTLVKQTKYPESSIVKNNPQNLKVDVEGAVKNPGVYILGGDSRVEDALKAAGGPTDQADPEYIIKSINLAQKVSDGMKIYLPERGEITSVVKVVEAGSSGQVSGTQTAVVNVNQADLSELDKLPGVGPVTAQKIIDNRPYNGIEELYTKKAVTRSVYEKIKNLVSTY